MAAALLDSLEYQQWCRTVPEVDNLVKTSRKANTCQVFPTRTRQLTCKRKKEITRDTLWPITGDRILGNFFLIIYLNDYVYGVIFKYLASFIAYFLSHLNWRRILYYKICSPQRPQTGNMFSSRVEKCEYYL